METIEQKTARNIRVAARYDELYSQGKHGHYETMFRVVREEVEAERERCAKLCEPNMPRPCGCDGCDCGNYDDAASVAQWDERTSLAAAIRREMP